MVKIFNNFIPAEVLATFTFFGAGKFRILPNTAHINAISSYKVFLLRIIERIIDGGSKGRVALEGQRLFVVESNIGE